MDEFIQDPDMTPEQENHTPVPEEAPIPMEPQTEEPAAEAAPQPEIPQPEEPTAEPAPIPREEPRFEAPPQPPKKKKGALGVIALALCFSLLGSILGAGGVLLVQYSLTGGQNPQNKPSSDKNNTAIQQGNHADTVIDITQIDTSKVMTPAQVYAANVNSTVGITTTITTNYWGHQSTSAATGSGFILTADGYILTNYHVVEGSSEISVATYSGESYPATLVGYDESNDLAILKVEAQGLTPVILGDSDNLNVGDSVVAIGNPLGELTFSLTSGAISAKDRKVTLSSTVTMELLQTDCAINSGNSGGPLFNLYGEVIGVTNAKYSGSSASGASIDNIGFAIPINSIKDIVKSVIEKGYLSKPYIGISVDDVSEETQQYGTPAGIAIQSVVEGSPAEQAGLKKWDIITAVNAEPMNSDEMVAFIRSCAVGDKIVLSIYRQGETLEITVTVGEQIQSPQQNSQTIIPGR